MISTQLPNFTIISELFLKVQEPLDFQREMHPTEDNTSLHSDSEIQAETNTEPKKKKRNSTAAFQRKMKKKDGV